MMSQALAKTGSEAEYDSMGDDGWYSDALSSGVLAKTALELLEGAGQEFASDISQLDYMLNAIGLPWSEVDNQIPSNFRDIGRLIDNFSNNIDGLMSIDYDRAGR